MTTTLLPKQNVKTILFSVLLPATGTEVTRGHAFLLDAFPPHRSRRFEFSVYSRDEPIDIAEPKPLRVLDAVRHMTLRIGFFLGELGLKPLAGAGPDWITPKHRRAFLAASGMTHAVVTLSSAARARPTLSRMLAAEAVQTKGFGSAL